MKDYKSKLKDYYNNYAAQRNEGTKKEWKLNLRYDFLDIMKENNLSSLLEIGAGTGQDSLFFKDNGLTVTSIDLSEEHIAICKEKGLKAYVMDFSAMSFIDNSFDCIYALNCLLHIPNADIISVLSELKRVVKKGGMLFLCQYGGNDDEGNKAYDNQEERFFSFRTVATFAEFISDAEMTIVTSTTIDIGVDYSVQYFVVRV